MEGHFPLNATDHDSNTVLQHCGNVLHATDDTCTLPQIHHSYIAEEQKELGIADWSPVRKLIQNSKKMPWKDGTCLVVRDSTLLDLEERMGPKFKVRVFSGATIGDLYFHLPPLLQKKPTNVTIMIGTNDAMEENSDVIANGVANFRKYVEKIQNYTMK